MKESMEKFVNIKLYNLFKSYRTIYFIFKNIIQLNTKYFTDISFLNVKNIFRCFENHFKFILLHAKNLNELNFQIF
jgi:hypothetical protein